MHLENLDNKMDSMFYINYEECKLQALLTTLNHSNTFYINYEECK